MGVMHTQPSKHDEICQREKKAWLILLIDFNKAFDSISRDFLTNALELMGFGEDMREWIKLFFNSREANIIINGHLSSTIKLQQGVLQGDVVSPYIFLLMVEILLIKISKPNIKVNCKVLCQIH